jgi:hypothetical protein
MTVRFERTTDNLCLVTARHRDRRPFPVSHMAGTLRIPHDLATFVVERELSIAGGFFNLVAHGAVFRSSGRRPTRPGRAVIVANRAALDEAERTVHHHQDLWAAHLPTPSGAALTDADERWKALLPGDGFEVTWSRLPLPARPRVRGDRGRRTTPPRS